MASSEDDHRSPSVSWQTEEEDDDAEFELAESGLSETTGDEITEDDEEDEDAQGTTIYFDAEDGTFRDEDGDEVDFELNEESAVEESLEESTEDNSQAEADADASTPREAVTEEAQQPQRQAQTIVLTPQEILQLLSHPGIRTETQQHILQLLSHPGIRGILSPNRGHRRSGGDDAPDADDDDDDEDVSFLSYSRRHRRPKREFVGERYPPIPSAEGQKLMDNGTFGVNDRCERTACGLPFSNTTLGKRKRLYRRMFDREMGVENRGRRRALNSLAVQSMIPKSRADIVINMNDRCYSGQFSDDGSFFFSCGQDYTVRMYDTSNPYDWKYYKKAHFYGGSWTITDATLSPDNKYLAYSSIRSQICLAGTDRNDQSDPTMLDISDMGTGGRGATGRNGWGHWGIWSVRFSGDGREIVAGTNDASVYVYDLESRRSILRIQGHNDDVNAVCYGDKLSPHILYSGSDDTTLKVWDRRSLASMRPAGMFLGHTEGLTYIDSKGDGRYVISNGKDQTCKLWDLRKMISVDAGERINPQNYTTNFDYRYPPYHTASHEPHPHDCSLVTFRGHRVLQTLIRCHFSPEHSTGGRYVYSGSYDGKVYVWNLDGTPASEPINVQDATKNSRSTVTEWKTIVRDCSWHPSAPVIAATSWNGWEHGRGTCSVHSWTDGVDDDEVGDGRDERSGDEYKKISQYSTLGSTPMGARVTAELRHNDRFYASQRKTRSGRESGARLAAFWGTGDDDDDDDDDDYVEG